MLLAPGPGVHRQPHGIRTGSPSRRDGKGTIRIDVVTAPGFKARPAPTARGQAAWRSTSQPDLVWRRWQCRQRGRERATKRFVGPDTSPATRVICVVDAEGKTLAEAVTVTEPDAGRIGLETGPRSVRL